MTTSHEGNLLRAAVLALGPAIGIGIARFAYGLVLPAMKTDLAWTYSQSGLMNTVNAVGYLVGAFVMGRLARRYGAARVFYAGTVITVIAILLLGTTGNFALLSVYRLMSGLSGAAIFVAGGALASEIAQRHPGARGTILSLFYAGPGFGIALTAIAVPLVFDLTGPLSWRLAWVVLGLLSLAAAAVCLLMRQRDASAKPTASAVPGNYRALKTMPILIGYTLFGTGSIGYMTFMVTNLQEAGLGPYAASGFWLLIGLASMAAPLLWGRAIGGLNHGGAFALLAGVNAIGALLPLVSTALPVIAMSALIFGSTFFSTVATTTAFAARNAGPADLSRAISYFTIAFGAGQSLGPIAIGLISDQTGSVEFGLALGVGAIVLGSMIGIIQRDQKA